ncbi:MAG: propionyl-CoA synthetase [Nitrospirae bacterium GWC2_57_13]|nr:MAG: propionyl-CoA synthetase [Nitrospirae bacterium GWC2_57_13]OGW46704.1 MAG: propionyl-CoA synthetase [Nitrospirae bacterium GWD2_57_8]
MGRYNDIFQKSISDPQGFWGKAAEAISWHKKWDKVLDDSNQPFYRWFAGGELNTCYNALDRHVESGRADQIALIYDSPVTKQVQKFTYRELRDATARFAGALRGLGVSKGDTVVIYMPMIPEAVTAMLACARLGAVHSVVFGGFAPNELAVRIDDAKPKVIVSASGAIEVSRLIEYKPMLDKAIELASHKPENCIVFQRPQVLAQLIAGRDHDWAELVAKSEPVDCVPVKATDPLYILYTSGTTGLPKGVVRDNGGHAVALQWSMEHIYNVRPGDVFWSASDVGWVVGHSYIVYGPLLAGCTTVLYEGKSVGTPDPGAFWRVISQHGVKVLFTAPTAFRAIKKEDPKGEYLKKYDLAGFKYLFLAGERLDPDTYHWASDLLKRPVIDHWWQTETGWPITANPMGIEEFPVKPGSSTMPVPGFDVRILDSNGKELGPDQEGIVAVKLPFPPGTLPTLWKNDDWFVKSYLAPFPGYYYTSDGGHKDRDGYFFIMGRIDDVINVAGHRLSTGSMEEVVSKHTAVAECAVIGARDALKGQLPVGLVVLKAGANGNQEEIRKELVKMVREQVGPIACFKQVAVVNRLPKTRSGKILRGTMRKIADGETYTVPATIDDPAILGEIETAMKGMGYGKDSSSRS